MIVLLDTHCFLWAAIDPEKLPGKAREVIADPAHEIQVSTVSFWEISIKFALGKLDLTGCAPDDLVVVAREMGLAIVAPSVEEMASFYRLPKLAHKDPFDRLLIWQCLQRDWTLISRDGAFGEYRELGLKTLWQ